MSDASASPSEAIDYASVPSPAAKSPSRLRTWVGRSWKPTLRMTGILLINTLLVAIIVGLLVATWLPAYIHHHPEIEIGESYAK
jgi:uncharacterized membrane protein YraQ (UPF0718 family)